MITEPASPVKGQTSLPVKAENIATRLCERDQWLLWRLESVDDRVKKVPYSAHTSRKADVTDKRNLAPYHAVLAAYRTGGWAGIGFVPLPEDDLAGIDLDHCRDPETGMIDWWAAQIVEELDSYT
jgi:primase-polymerase (primpol)-like protein